MSAELPAGGTPRKLLYISDRIGGESKENAEVIAVLDELLRMRDDVCPAPGPEDLRIDLVFDVPGPLLGVDYNGARTGIFSSSEQMLQIQVAVPTGLSGADIRGYLIEALNEMVKVARRYKRRRVHRLSTKGIETAVRDLVARLRR